MPRILDVPKTMDDVEISVKLPGHQALTKPSD